MSASGAGAPAAPRWLAARLFAAGVLVFAHFITAVRGIWAGIEPSETQRVYFANHTSNGDFILIWTVLPSRIRRRTRPVAAADYWLKTRLRAFIGRDVFNAVLIQRKAEDRKGEEDDPVALMAKAIDDGASLIIFPEGRRNETDAPLLPFKSGLYHLAATRPSVELVPVWVANLNRVMPRGEVVPIPLLCTVTFGPPLSLHDGESKEDFIARAEAALMTLSPEKVEA